MHELKLVRSGLVETQGGLTDEIAGDKSRQAATAAALVAQAEAAAAEAAAAGGSTDRVRAELVVQQDLSRSLKEQVRKLPESESVGHGLVCGVCVIYRVDVQVRQLQESEDILRTQAEASQAAAAAALADAQAALKEKAAVLAEEQARARAQEKQASDLLAGTCAWKHTRALLSLYGQRIRIHYPVYAYILLSPHRCAGKHEGKAASGSRPVMVCKHILLSL